MKKSNKKKIKSGNKLISKKQMAEVHQMLLEIDCAQFGCQLKPVGIFPCDNYVYIDGTTKSIVYMYSYQCIHCGQVISRHTEYDIHIPFFINNVGQLGTSL